MLWVFFSKRRRLFFIKNYALHWSIDQWNSQLKVEGANENYLKSQYIPVPESLSDFLPAQNVRLALRNGRGFYHGFCPPMVSVYLVPTNDSKKRERTLVETVILTPMVNDKDQLAALKEK